jgi:cytochrome P450
MNTLAPPTDAIAAVTHADPYPWYAMLREGPPLAFDAGLRLWIAARADVVREALAHPALRVRPATEPVPRAIAGSPAGEVFGHLVRMNDGAPHAACKPPLQAALAQLDLREAHAVALRIAQNLPRTGLAAACSAIPVRAVARLLGFADEELPQVSDWMADFVACLSPLSSAAQLDAAGASARLLMTRFEQLAFARPAPGASLLAALQRQAPGCAARPWLANLVGLLSQTFEATAGLLGNGLVALARAPGLRQEIGSRFELLSPLVAEVARHDPAVHNTRRYVAEPMQLGGMAFAPGDALLLLLAAANRDPALNPAPDDFALLRAERRCLGFGHGPHACPGQALACTVAAAGLQALLSQGLDLDALNRRGWDYRPSVNVRMPVFR